MVRYGIMIRIYDTIVGFACGSLRNYRSRPFRKRMWKQPNRWRKKKKDTGKLASDAKAKDSKESTIKHQDSFELAQDKKKKKMMMMMK